MLTHRAWHCVTSHGKKDCGWESLKDLVMEGSPGLSLWVQCNCQDPSERKAGMSGKVTTDAESKKDLRCYTAALQ